MTSDGSDAQCPAMPVPVASQNRVKIEFPAQFASTVDININFTP